MRPAAGPNNGPAASFFGLACAVGTLSFGKIHLPDIQIVGYSDTYGSICHRVGRRGTVVLPAKLRRRLGIEEGSFVVAEERDNGILIRPATVLPLEVYTPERRAEFLLNNALSADDYRRARAAVKRMDLDPDRIKRSGTR
jgi:AbrB family looped-hinge helix DNA binding protein